MSDTNPVRLTPSGPPETILPPPSPALEAALRHAAASPESDRRRILTEAVRIDPRSPDVWAELGSITSDPVERYAYFRVGYHRGLDALRANGWRGSGYVRAVHPTNRGFLACLIGLADAAERLGEADETERCRLFVRQLDPGH
jgi:hypothetical protein